MWLGELSKKKVYCIVFNLTVRMEKVTKGLENTEGLRASSSFLNFIMSLLLLWGCNIERKISKSEHEPVSKRTDDRDESESLFFYLLI